MATYVWTLPGTITDTSIEPLRRDMLLAGDNNGVRFLFDLENRFCYDAGAPTAGKAVRDIAEISAAGAVAQPTALLTSAGGGIDFSSTDTRDFGVRIPATVSADLWADQEYIICSYYKMPAIGNYPTVTSGLASPFFTATSALESYANSPEIVISAWDRSTSGWLSFRRQTALNAYSLAVLVPTTHAGQVVQMAVYRTASGWAVRIKSPAGTSTAAGAGNAKNTLDFSAKQINFGIFGIFGPNTELASRTGRRLYRGWVENLHRSGRDPVAVLDADYARTVSRGVFS